MYDILLCKLNWNFLCVKLVNSHCLGQDRYITVLLQLNGNTYSGDAMPIIEYTAYESHVYEVSKTVPIINRFVSDSS